jgi:hypothetical protein
MSYLTEAFKQMELLESEQFTFDKDGATKLANFLDDDMLNDFEAIIDPEAETKEELKDSYMGNVICRCPICRSLIYRDPEEIKVDEEEQLANLEEPCPYCFEHGGFEIVGQVAPYEEVTVEGADENTKVEVDGQEVNTDPEAEEDREEVLDESLNEGTIYDKLVNAFPELADDSMSEIRSKRRHARDNEDIEDSQRFPVEGTKQRNLMEKRCAKRRHTRDNEDLEDSQRYPIVSPVGTKGLNESIDPEIDKISKYLASEVTSKYPSAKVKPTEKAQIVVFFDDPTKEDEIKKFAMTTLEKDLGYKANNVRVQYQSNNNKIFGVILGDISDEFINNKGRLKELSEQEENYSKVMGKKRHVRDNEDLEDSQRYPIESPAPAQTGLRESMEDISITTDDQVIKVKATPRADKETIQPVEDETKDVIEAPIEEEVPEDMPTEDQDIEIEEFDEESFDNLGESYLRQVYENVSSFKTSDVQSTTNKIIVEGIISFNSGKKAKTKFMFEAKDATKSGKLRFTGLNENISKNKKAFTLTGTLKENKLISESLNYNYSAQAENGKSKRLYGTVRR